MEYERRLWCLSVNTEGGTQMSIPCLVPGPFQGLPQSQILSQVCGSSFIPAGGVAHSQVG